MQILYAITFRPKNNHGSDLLQKIKLVADDQLQAVNLASQKGLELEMEVVRVEELQAIENEIAPYLLNANLTIELMP